MDKELAVQEILNDLENQPLQERRTFRAYLNQPELISLSSANAEIQSAPINPQTDNAYYNFTVNLPRPALDAKSLQLLKAIIPQAQCSIPDYSLVFPYYKLRTVPLNNEGKLLYVDNPADIDVNNTLNMIRLLPTNYKLEIVDLSGNNTGLTYGYNKTFNDYEEVLTEINKACLADPTFTKPFGKRALMIPGDISFEFDKDFNKFVLVGNNVSTPNVYPTWSSITTYTINKVVKYNSIDYVSLQTTTGNTPDVSPTYWRNVSQYYTAQPKFNTYLIAGYNDPNVIALIKHIEFASTNKDNFLVSSIPGNKYVLGQTLARRLGFTWNYNGMITDNTILNNLTEKGVEYGGTTALFFNRVRPVPYYEFLELTDPPPAINSLCNKYTADGYCNLVYSSIISIYTIIVGTSSVDTQRNANLLAMVEMNCGNLGVAMASGFIDTKLTKIQTDIYSIYIELRDENGEPYYLTNNATSTFLLKLTYD